MAESDQVLLLDVDAVEKPCGLSSVSLNGQPLLSAWNGIKAQGSGFIDIKDARLPRRIAASWHIKCLNDTITVEGENNDAIQVLSLVGGTEEDPAQFGFTISYKSHGIPHLIRLSSDIWQVDTIASDSAFWRTEDEVFGLQIPFHQGDRVDKTSSAVGQSSTLSFHGQQLLHVIAEKVKAVKSSANKLITSCHTGHGQHEAIVFGGEKAHGITAPAKQLEASPTPSATETTTMSHNVTRSLTSPLPVTDPGLDHDESVEVIKVAYFFLLLVSVSSFLYRHFSDPRRRADRAARREERRNKRLYRCAARQQQWKNWLCGLRGHDHRSPRKWDEKQEEILEKDRGSVDAMRGELRALTTAFGVVNTIVRAEEGRTGYVYAYGVQERPDSLPGYESDEMSPPAYSSEREDFTPDSSVIDTSPRTSDDGRDSDFDKD